MTDDLGTAYIINHFCEKYQAEEALSGKPKGDEIDWTINAEILFSYALMGHKPVGVNRHFMMMFVHNKFSAFIGREISSKPIWDHCDALYDMAALHESEVIPFPNEETDFELPECCHDLLEYKYGVRLGKSSEEKEINKSNTSVLKPTKKVAPKFKQSSTSKNIFASPVINKTPKNLAAVKSETKAIDSTSKVKHQVSSKTAKVKRSSSPLVNKPKFESPSVIQDSPLDVSSIKKKGSKYKSGRFPLTKEESDISNKKNLKIERGNSPTTLKKSAKVELTGINIPSKKPVKCEYISTNTVKLETADVPVKNKDHIHHSKSKLKIAVSLEPSGRKVKLTGHCSKKSSEYLPSKHVKTEFKSVGHSSKGQEAEASTSTGSRKSSPLVKVSASDSSTKKLKLPKTEEFSKKSPATPKRRR